MMGAKEKRKTGETLFFKFEDYSLPRKEINHATSFM
jgi:hypothetical protein